MQKKDDNVKIENHSTKKINLGYLICNFSQNFIMWSY